MKKLYGIILLILLTSGFNFAQYTKLWEVNIGKYSWFANDAMTRSIAYNPVSTHVLVASRTVAPAVYALNSSTGDIVDTLDMSGISGGLFPINIVRVANDGVIYLCNLASANGSMKIYRWANESSAPTLACEATVVNRVGDAFEVSGSGANTRLYAGGSTSPIMEVFTTTDGVNFSKGTEITLPGAGLARGTISAIGSTQEDGFWVNGAGTKVTHITGNGTAIESDKDGVINTGWHCAEFFERAGKKFLAVNGRNLASDGLKTLIYDITIETTPVLFLELTLTNTYNTNTYALGDVQSHVNSDNSVTLFQLVSNNGIAAYKIDAPVISTPLLLEEQFDYTAGDLLTTHGWASHSGTSNFIPVSAEGLSYAGYSNGAGNAASLTTTGQDINKKFTETTSGSLYASFLVNIASAQGTGDYFFHFAPTDITTNIFMGRVFAKQASNGKIAFGLSKTSTNATILPVYSDSIYNTNETYLIVLKYKFGPAEKDDSVYLFINPTLNKEPVSILAHSNSSNNDPANLGSVCLRQGTASNAPTLKVDEIRIHDSWLGVVPVELASFKSNVSGNNVVLSWQTATETNNMGFEVYRNNEMIKFVPGFGTTTEKRSYSFEDKSVSTGKHSYKLIQVDYSGIKETVGNIEVDVNAVPAGFSLNQNYPNPFNPSTVIAFSLPVDARVNLRIINVLGEEVATLVNSNMASGQHQVTFNAADFNSGIYFYSIEVNGIDGNNFSGTRKMMLIK